MKCVQSKMRHIALFLLLALAVPGAFAPEKVLAASDTIKATDTAQITIKEVKMVGTGADQELVIEVSSPVAYTSYKTSAPNRLVIDFSQTVFVESLGSVEFANGPVSKLITRKFETEAGVLTRMELYLPQDLQPVIKPSPDKTGELRIAFPGFVLPVADVAPALPVAVEAAPVPDSAPAPVVAQESPSQPPEAVASSTVSDQAVQAAKPTTVTDVVSRDGGVEVLVDGAFKEYKTMRLSKPERLVIDLMDVQAGAVARLIQLNTAGLSTARIGTYPGKVRVVLDAVNGSLPDAAYEHTPAGIRVSFVATADSRQQPDSQTQKASSAVPAVQGAAPVPVAETNIASGPATKAAPGRIEAIDFQVVDGISRVSVKASGAVSIGEPVKTPGFITLNIKNALLPRSLQRSFESQHFPSSVLRVTPVQMRTKTGHDAMIRVALRVDMPYELRREADMLYLDIKNPVEEKKIPSIAPVTGTSRNASSKAAAVLPVEQIVQDNGQQAPDGKVRYTGRKVTLEFADAEVGKILQLLAEVSNRNFIFSDDVGKQKINMKLANVPWDQALAIILETNGLDKYDDGNVTQIRKKGSFKSQREEEIELRKATYRSEPLVTELIEVNYSKISDIKKQFEGIRKAYGDLGTIEEDERTGKIIVTGIAPAIAEMKKLHKELDVPERQVMIEARIVEASSAFTRSLGVNWGIHYRDGSASIAGINSFDTSFGGIASNVPPTSGVSGTPGGSAGISFGTLASNIKLDLRLNAAVSAGMVRIVSTPKVATLNRKTAKITQGQQIPYTASTSDKVETKFVEAALALEVTPNINPNGTIIMKIDAKNDAPGATGNPPAINKKQATTEMMLRDGETTVIGGIFVESDTVGDEGVPFLQDVPWLGNLFKSSDVKRNRNELLIFITPRILGNNP